MVALRPNSARTRIQARTNFFGIINSVTGATHDLGWSAIAMRFSSYKFKILFLPLALARNLALCSATLSLLTCAAMHFCAIAAIPVSADQSKPPRDDISATGSPISNAINQNTPGQSEGYALGVPRNYDWYKG